MDTRVCPSIQFDAGDADATSTSTTRCEVDVRGARFSLGRVESEEVRSALLHELMTRTRITLRVKLRSLGYREIQFTLHRSMQAMAAVLGQGVQVITGGSLGTFVCSARVRGRATPIGCLVLGNRFTLKEDATFASRTDAVINSLKHLGDGLTFTFEDVVFSNLR